MIALPPSTKLKLLSPAKLNLFLHILGRREDGYHELQTLFQLLDYGDNMTFSLRDDHTIKLLTEMPGITDSNNLILKAATALKNYTGCRLGAAISIEKRLPMGGGLGGGSSNAATTLLGLNHLWQTQVSMAELCSIGKSLGADIPVFLQGRTAWAEGIGERLRPLDLPQRWYLVVYPNLSVSTHEVFSCKQLTRDTGPITVAHFLEQGGHNDCESALAYCCPMLLQALESTRRICEVSLTGTGSCFFATARTRKDVERLGDRVNNIDPSWSNFVAQGVNHLPLFNNLSDLTV